jgi:hypothetical protein
LAVHAALIAFPARNTPTFASAHLPCAAGPPDQPEEAAPERSASWPMAAIFPAPCSPPARFCGGTDIGQQMFAVRVDDQRTLLANSYVLYSFSIQCYKVTT